MGLIARLGRRLGLLCVVWFPALEANARELGTEEAAEIAQCIKAASQGALWLERTLWGLRDQEGGWIGAEIANADGTHDLGPLQINSWWVPRISAVLHRPAAEVRHWLIYDACFNVRAARWIFLSGLSAGKDYWKAVGMYHSPTPWRQERYALAVAAHLRRRFGSDVFSGRTGNRLRP